MFKYRIQSVYLFKVSFVLGGYLNIIIVEIMEKVWKNLKKKIIFKENFKIIFLQFYKYFYERRVYKVLLGYGLQWIFCG